LTRFVLFVLLALTGQFANLRPCANCTVVGTINLSATFEALSYQVNWTGDANGDNSATVRFRASGGRWHDAYPPLTDRRATIGGDTNPYANQFRGSIVGLTANTTYDVSVTVHDPNNANATVVGTISTVTTTPTTGGSTITVTDDATLATALSTVNPGQTVHLNAATYAPFTISRSGTAGAFVKIEGESAGTSIVTGAGVTQNIAINANYLVLSHLALSASDFNALLVSSSAHDVYVQDNTISNVSRLCADGPTSTHYGDAGIGVGGGASNIFVLRNSITSTSLAACVQSPTYNGPGEGISWGNCTTCVFTDNTVVGAFRDAVTADASDILGINIDVARNSVSGYVDDGIESKGANVNTRIWGNVITLDSGNTCFATNTNLATNPYGPVYIFRNTCRGTGPAGDILYKMNGDTPSYIFHNSVDASPASSNYDGFVFSSTLTAFNNILKTKGSVIDYGIGTFDYNLLMTTAGTFVFHWNLVTDYTSWALFKSGTGQETHGINSDPSFSDAALHLGVSSPAIDVGIVIPNFNTADSSWPFKGTAPDLGAWER